MAAMFAEDTARLCGPDGKHNPGRAGYRHGSEAGSVTLGGRRLPVTQPRVRAADGSGELHLPSYDLFSPTAVLSQMAPGKMLAGLSSRRYTAGLEPAGQAVDDAATSTSKSAVSRRFVAATETALAELMSRPLDDLDLVAFMVDRVHSGEHTCVVALGIGIDGTKHPWPWRRARPRTPPWSLDWSLGCASAAWTSPSPSSLSCRVNFRRYNCELRNRTVDRAA
jgi:putative transposase